MAIVFPESMDRIDYKDLTESMHTLEDYVRYICDRVEYTYGQLFKDIGTSGELAVPIALAVSNLQKDVKELQNQLAGISAEATAALNKASRLEDVVGDANSGLVKTVNDILTDIQAIQTAIGSDEAGHESGILGDIKTMKSTIGDSNSGLVKDVADLQTTVADHEQRITALENQ